MQRSKNWVSSTVDDKQSKDSHMDRLAKDQNQESDINECDQEEDCVPAAEII